MRNSIAEDFRPVLQNRSSKERMMPLFLRLYRGHLLFRSLLDLSVVGFLVLVFTGNIPWPSSLANSARNLLVENIVGAPSIASQPVPPSGRNPVALSSFSEVSMITIDQAEVNRASPRIKRRITEAMTLLQLRGVQMAREHLLPDIENPTVAYAYATLLVLPGGEVTDTITKLTHFRAATDKGVKEAFTAMGQLQFVLSMRLNVGVLSHAEPNAVDGAGNAYVADARELRRQARLWWERGAALGSAASTRFLGMLEALGYDEKPDISAAVAYWRDATRQGDAFAPMDLGIVHLYGSDIAGDKNAAVDNFKTAVDRGNWRAGAFLAMELLSRAKSGDEDAAKMAIDSLGSVVDLAYARSEMQGMIISSEALGRIYLEYAPAAMRDAKLGIGFLTLAANNKSIFAAMDLAKYYQTGTFVDQNLVEAYRLLNLVHAKSRENKLEIKKRLDHLLSEMNDLQRDEVNRNQDLWTMQASPMSQWHPDLGFTANGHPLAGVKPVIVPLKGDPKKMPSFKDVTNALK